MRDLVGRKPAADFFIRMVGAGIRPWDVPLRILARVLEATQRLVDPPSDEVAMYADEANEDVDDTAEGTGALERPILRLLDIRLGSAGYAVAGAEALPRLIHAGNAILRPSEAEWATSEVRSLDELSSIARSLGCEIEFRTGSLKGDVVARITPTTISEIAGNAFVEGDTTAIGRVERVGGATKLHCGLRIPDQSRMLICQVASADLARDLGQYLYQTVVVSGRALWLRKNWEIKRLHVRSFEPPKTGSVLKALETASRAGAHVWDDIKDPEKFIADMRG